MYISTYISVFDYGSTKSVEHKYRRPRMESALQLPHYVCHSNMSLLLCITQATLHISSYSLAQAKYILNIFALDSRKLDYTSYNKLTLTWEPPISAQPHQPLPPLKPHKTVSGSQTYQQN